MGDLKTGMGSKFMLCEKSVHVIFVFIIYLLQ